MMYGAKGEKRSLTKKMDSKTSNLRKKMANKYVKKNGKKS